MSTETKHTPGPWEVERMDGSSRNYIIAPRSHTLAMVFENVHLPPERAEADARLMAAAPELLKALEAINNAFRVDRTAFTEEQEQAVTLMDAALEKATGEKLEPLSEDEIAAV